jgi:hypothetical protein
MTDPISIAGLVVSGISLLNDLSRTVSDLTKWQESDLEVDSEWLGLALAKGIIDGNEGDFAWPRSDRVATLELKGTHDLVVPFNKDQRKKYRVVRGPASDRLVLMRKLTDTSRGV